MVNYPEPHQEVEPHEGGVDSDSKPLKFKQSEKVADGTVIILKIPTRANFADVHTKAV